MKGLVIKDLLQLKQSLIFILFVILSYTYFGIINGDASYLLFVMAGVLNMMTPLTCAGYDEQCHWDSFGASFPISRTKVVLARYITGIVTMVASLLMVLISHIITLCTSSTPISWVIYAGMIVISLFINALMNPIIYKFGVQKSRFVLLAISSVTIVLSSMSLMLFTTSDRDWVVSISEKIGAFIDKLSQIPDGVIMLILLAIFGVLYALSIRLSISIYKKKDL